MRRTDRNLTQTQDRRMADIAWDPGPSGWVTINTDGAVNLGTGRAATGGLIRNEFGHCLAVFTMNIGCCTINRAELRGVITGLCAAWDRGFRKVQLQTDSTTILKLVMNEVKSF
ncbi:Putative ribonuclease H protein At1g65750 [Linum perenne]